MKVPKAPFALVFLVATAVALLNPSFAQAPGALRSASMSRLNYLPARTHFGRSEGSGTMEVTAPDGKKMLCPLKHTDVSATVSGYVARVTVKQHFANPFKDKIEAVYTFPLSDNAAVDGMTMRVGNRTISGVIKKRDEAELIYESARSRGHVASLLNQERANIFTQNVANIEPGKEVDVTISYVELLQFEAGSYSFVFPTVVGPRFIPGKPIRPAEAGFAPDTRSVPDASKITPLIAPEGVRSGHDLSISVDVDAGMPITNVRSLLHHVKISNASASRSSVSLTDEATIPNKDFVLKWDVVGDRLQSGYLTNGKGGNGFVTLMIVPPKHVTPEVVQPKEMVFVIDCSGSQTGKPLEKAKETVIYCLDHMNARDTFQVIAFSNGVTKLFNEPESASAKMKEQARKYVASLRADGGTWMASAVTAAAKNSPDAHRLRVVSFMTDGYVGNDMEVLGLVRKLRGTSRWFIFGTGNSVNRFLIDNMAKEGGGEADYVYLDSSAEEVGKKFYSRIASPILTDVKIDWGGLGVLEAFPKEVSDVWAERPLYFNARYQKEGTGTVTISGYSGGTPYKQTLNVALPQEKQANEALGSIWARAKVDRLLSEDWFGAQQGKLNKELKDEIVSTALAHHIMTPYTSFVAVDDSAVTVGGALKEVDVNVELPDGVSRLGAVGHGKQNLPLPSSSYQRGSSSSTYNLRFKSGNSGRSVHGRLGAVTATAGSSSGGMMPLTTMGRRLTRTSPFSGSPKRATLPLSSAQREAAQSKMTEALKKLVKKRADAQLALAPGMPDSSPRISVRVTLDDDSAAVLAEVERADALITERVVADKTLVVLIMPEEVVRLAGLVHVVKLDVGPEMESD